MVLHFLESHQAIICGPKEYVYFFGSPQSTHTLPLHHSHTRSFSSSPSSFISIVFRQNQEYVTCVYHDVFGAQWFQSWSSSQNDYYYYRTRTTTTKLLLEAVCPALNSLVKDYHVHFRFSQWYYLCPLFSCRRPLPYQTFSWTFYVHWRSLDQGFALVPHPHYGLRNLQY